MPSSRIFIGNVPFRCRERDVEKFFKNFGRIREVVLKEGYGFVEFDDPRDAEDAVRDMDGRDLLGERVRVEAARSRDRDRRDGGDRGRYGAGAPRSRAPGPRTNYRIHVDNVASRTSWQDLKDFFRVAGEITYANVHSPRQGQGVVEFADRRGLQYALDNQDDLELDGHRLKIKEEGRGGGGRDRSPSRSKSRTPPRRRSRSRSRSSRSRTRSTSRSRSNDRN